MDAAHTIRDCIAEVARLRLESATQPALAAAVSAIKRFQARRFAATYRDLMVGGPYQAATRFFLTELYADSDFTSRDEQFARIAGALQHLLPQVAIDTAVTLARLHVLTERLDLAMGHAWNQVSVSGEPVETYIRYAHAWRLTGQEKSRREQLERVLEVGRDLDTLTRKPGLRLVLKMMRRPADAAGLSDLQRFLEQGFDIFAAMGREKGSTNEFLQLIDVRETTLIRTLFCNDERIAIDALALVDQDNSLERNAETKKNAQPKAGRFSL